MVIGLLHPGEMGAAIGAVLRERGETVLWASEGRGAESAQRAEAAGLEDAGTIAEVARRSDVVFSVCPPHAALDVARALPPFDGIFVDGNAISPDSSREIAGLVGRYVDGGIVGMAPTMPGVCNFYLSGAEAAAVAELFAGTIVDARVLSDEPGAASALKAAYAAWTKGCSALLVAIRALARAEGVEQALVDEWNGSLPGVEEQSVRAARSAAGKGWRWIGEMEEIADTFAAAGLPDGFHRAAAEVFRRAPRDAASAEDVLDQVVSALAAPRA